MARRSAWIEPVSLIAIVPVALCNCPTVTTLSVTASTRGPALAGFGAGVAASAVLSAAAAFVSLLQPSSGVDSIKAMPATTLAQRLGSRLVLGTSGRRGEAGWTGI